MAQYTVTPTFIEWKRKYSGRYGEIHVFNMTVENEDGVSTAGVFTTTKEDQNKFKVGEKVLVEMKKTEEDHEKIWKIDKVTERSSKGNGGYTGKGDPRKESYIKGHVSLECASMFLIGSGQTQSVKPNLEALKAVASKIYAYLKEKGVDTQQAINFQAHCKHVTHYFFQYENVPLSTSQEMFGYVDILDKWLNEIIKT